MNQDLEASRQTIRSDGISRLEPAEELVQSVSQGANNQKSQKLQMPALAQRENRLNREALRARRSKMASIIKEQIDQKEQQEHFQCQVCSKNYNMKEIKLFGNCKHRYCRICLHKHIANSIKSFKTVKCLDEKCRQFLDISSPHIRALSLPLQQKYYKIRIALNSQRDEDIRMCPTQNCEGFVKLSDKRLECPICEVQICRKCFFPKHSGKCDQNGVLYMEKNYLFRRCDRCKMVLEKNEGCNHMTCKCGYQFCYKCGESWFEGHQCKPKRTVAQSLPHLIIPQSLARVQIARNNRPADIRLQQQQASNIQLQPQRIADLAADNKHHSCLTSTLKIALVIFVRIITAEMFSAIFFILIPSIVSAIGIFFFSFATGMKQMIEKQSCVKIVFLNVFLYLFYVATQFLGQYTLLMKYIRRDVFTLNWLFPISSSLYQYLNKRWF